MTAKRNILVRKLYRLTRKLAQIEEDWDVNLEEKIIEEQSAWEEREQTKKELEEDKLKRLQSPGPGWDEYKPEKIEQEVLTWFAGGNPSRPKGLAREMFYTQFLNEFISKEYKTLNNIVKKHGGGTPRYLGAGVYGSAWLLDDGTVLKVFIGAPDEAYKAYGYDLDKIYSRENDSSEHLMVHEYGSFKNIRDHDFSWAVMEKFTSLKEAMSDLPDELRRRIVALMKTIDKKFSNLYYKMVDGYKEDPRTGSLLPNFKPESKETFLLNVSLFKEDIEDIFGEYLPEIREALNLPDNWLDQLINQFKVRYLQGKTDTHTGNIGIRESTGELIFYDA